ncbi:hypothetical protein [Microvirga sp. M2]|uniref:hypothetical protein n=1 Tax=Microvirga sp. M2 TaxID=3073270 RepID=UPI0039C2BFC4
MCIYNNPGTTKCSFSDDVIAHLAKLPNVAAVKLPLPADGDFAGEMERLRAITPEGFAIGYSGYWGAADALLAVTRGTACWRDCSGISAHARGASCRRFGSHAHQRRISTAVGPVQSVRQLPRNVLDGRPCRSRQDRAAASILPLPQEVRTCAAAALQNLKDIEGFPP